MKTLVEYLCDNIVIGIITESKKVDDFMTIFLKQNKDLQDGLLRDLLMRGDPTSVSNDRGDFVGKYGTWIGNLAKEDKLSQDDVTTLHDALTIYHANKSKVEKDIKDIVSLDELISIVKDLDPNFKPEKTKSKVEQNGDLEKVYDDKFVTVYVPHTYEASRYIGGDTHWCTASSDGGRMFRYYLKEYGGEYYAIIRKKDDDKFQLHVESEQFMNAGNQPINFGSIFSTKEDAAGLIKFLQEKRGKDINQWIKFRMPNDELEEFIKNASEKELKDEDIEISDDNSKGYSEGYYVIRYHRKNNWISKDGKLLTDDWWYYCWGFKDGYGVVRRDDKMMNWIGKDGQPLTKEWWKHCGNFDDGYAFVQRDDGKQNWMGKDGKPLTIDWWINCCEFNDGYAIVRRDDYKWNWMGTNGKPLTKKWWKSCGMFRYGYGVVRRDDNMMNWIDKDGKPLSKDWWEECSVFINGYAMFRIKDKYYHIDTKGNYYDENKKPIDKPE